MHQGSRLRSWRDAIAAVVVLALWAPAGCGGERGTPVTQESPSFDISDSALDGSDGETTARREPPDSGAEVLVSSDITTTNDSVDGSLSPQWDALHNPQRPPVPGWDSRSGDSERGGGLDGQPITDPGGVADAGPDCPENSCTWLGQPCAQTSAMVEVVALDVWAQPLTESTLTFYPGWPAASDPLVFEDALVVNGPLCESAAFTVELTAEHHDDFAAEVTYSGSGEPGDLSILSTGEEAAWTITTDLRETPTGPQRHYTLWVGLVHRWFAPSGRPARHGNAVELLVNGEDAFEEAYAAAVTAETSIIASTWWWNSDFELTRDPATHIWLDQQTRWENTILGVLEAKGWEGVESKVLVNQFFSQDGLLSSVSYDGWLSSSAQTPGNGIEFMGQANEISGVFLVDFAPVDFAERISWSWMMPDGYEVLHNTGVTPPMEPYVVDMSELPLGLSLVDVPHAVWHQKFISVDHQVAVVGGMNFKSTDWDTSKHALYQWRRMEYEASVEDREAVLQKEMHSDTEPRRDYMLRLEGPIVGDLESVFAWRWQTLLAWGVNNAELSTDFELGGLPPAKEGGVQAQVLTTMPPPWGELGVADALLRAINQAEHYILIEDQYFRSQILAEHIAQRMIVTPELHLIVVTNEVGEWEDPGCWQTYMEGQFFESLFPDRFHLFTLKTWDAHDVGCVLCWDETLGEIERVFVHSKLVLIDDTWALVGSTNHNNRGLLYEGEMSIAVFDPPWVFAARDTVVTALLGPWYGEPGLPMKDLPNAFEGAAGWNQMVYEAWSDASWDLDLDGDPLPFEYVQDGFLYPLETIGPENCLFENVGADIM